MFRLPQIPPTDTLAAKRGRGWLFLLMMPALAALLLLLPLVPSPVSLAGTPPVSGLPLRDVVSDGEGPAPAPSAQTPPLRTHVLSRMAGVGVTNTTVAAEAGTPAQPFPGLSSQRLAVSAEFRRATTPVNQSALGRAPPASFFRS